MAPVNVLPYFEDVYGSRLYDEGACDVCDDTPSSNDEEVKKQAKKYTSTRLTSGSNFKKDRIIAKGPQMTPKINTHKDASVFFGELKSTTPKGSFQNHQTYNALPTPNTQRSRKLASSTSAMTLKKFGLFGQSLSLASTIDEGLSPPTPAKLSPLKRFTHNGKALVDTLDTPSFPMPLISPPNVEATERLQKEILKVATQSNDLDDEFKLLEEITQGDDADDEISDRSSTTDNFEHAKIKAELESATVGNMVLLSDKDEERMMLYAMGAVEKDEAQEVKTDSIVSRATVHKAAAAAIIPAKTHNQDHSRPPKATITKKLTARQATLYNKAKKLETKTASNRDFSVHNIPQNWKGEKIRPGNAIVVVKRVIVDWSRAQSYY